MVRSVEYRRLASDMGCVPGAVADTTVRPPDRWATPGVSASPAPGTPAVFAGRLRVPPRVGRRGRQVQSLRARHEGPASDGRAGSGPTVPGSDVRGGRSGGPAGARVGCG